MLTLATAEKLAQHLGRDLGASDWFLVEQDLLTRFAEVTGDFTWHHTDPERAAREMPGGKTIAHGLLLLSLLPRLYRQIVDVQHFTARVFNYGFNKVRFIRPVPVGARIRLHACVPEMERRGDALIFRRELTLEIEGSDGPAMVAEWLLFVGGV